MKKILLTLFASVTLLILISSCKKSDQPAPATPEGKWLGTGQYGTTPGDPTYVFSLTFNADGMVDIIGNNNTVIDTAQGTWELIQDSVRASYTYHSGTALYTLSGKFSPYSNTMSGTIGLGGTTTGIGVFSVTRQ